MRRRLAIVVSAFLLVRTATAGDAPPEPPAPKAPATLNQAADVVLAAVKAGDAKALAALTTIDDPDPWIVADELVRRKEPAAALAFARAAPRADTERLAAYLMAREGTPDDAARRDRLKAVNRAFATEDMAAALEALGPAAAAPIDDVLGLRLAMARALALGTLDRLPEAEAAFGATAEAAERIGWLARGYDAQVARGEAASTRGALDVALDAWQHARDVAEKRGDVGGGASANLALGGVHADARRPALASECFERALVLARRAGDHGIAAQALLRLGGLHDAGSNYAKALECLQGAVEEARAAGEPAWEASALDGIGVVHMRLGDFAKALAFLERAKAAHEALGSPADVAQTLGKIGMVYDLLADYPKAREIAEKVLELQKAVGDPRAVATALSELGIAHARLGEHEKAIEFYGQALAGYEAIGDRAAAVALRINLGEAQAQAGHLDEALVTYTRALAQAEDIGARQWKAEALDNLGALHSQREDRAKAIEFRERAVRARTELGDRAGLARTYMALALERYARKDWAGALEAARAGAALAPTVVAGLGDEQGATARSQLASLFAVGAAAATELHADAAVWDFMERGRAGSLIEALGARDALRAALVPPALVAAETEARAKEAAAALAYRQALDEGDRQRTRARIQELDAARAAVDDVVQRIQREAKAAANLVHFAPDAPEVLRRHLGPEDALVLYGLGPETALAFVATADGARTVKLGPAADVQVACEALMEALRAREETDDWRGAADALRNLVVAPLGLPAGIRRVLLSPSDALSAVPFALLLPDRELAYVPSGTTYGLLVQDKPARGTGVLALGDPDYETRRASPAPGEAQRSAVGRLARLPGTAVEAKAVGGTVLLGPDATERRLRETAAKNSRWRSIHFACHGIVDTERAGYSSLALTADVADDGFLTVLEVFRSHLPADLVVLSACETATGKAVQGEGVMGLTRAFMFAGSPRVICSLWKVDDAATQALMVKFYELWNPKEGPGVPTAAALREAQAFVRSQPRWKHPYFWAAWVLWGLPD